MSKHQSDFQTDLQRFNSMYRLPAPAVPTTSAIGSTQDVINRLKNFKKILLEELDELDDIVELLENPTPDEVKILTELADLLGDIQVYCGSEMTKFGLPIDPVLKTIMDSNFSKLGADGNPIYDERGKVQKGPNYWKPEPTLQAFIEELKKVELQ